MKKLFASIAIALTTVSLAPKPALAAPDLHYVGRSVGGDVYLLDYNSLRRNGTMVQYSYGTRLDSVHYDSNG